MNKFSVLSAVVATAAAQKSVGTISYATADCTNQGTIPTTATTFASSVATEFSVASGSYFRNSEEVCGSGLIPTSCAIANISSITLTATASKTDEYLCDSAKRIGIKYTTDASTFTALSLLSMKDGSNDCTAANTEAIANAKTGADVAFTVGANAAVTSCLANHAINFTGLAAKIYAPAKICVAPNTGCLKTGASTSLKFPTQTPVTVCKSTTVNKECVTSTNCTSTMVYDSAPGVCSTNANTNYFYKGSEGQVCATGSLAKTDGTCGATPVCVKSFADECVDASALLDSGFKSFTTGEIMTAVPKAVCFAKSCATKNAKTCYEIGATKCHRRSATGWYKFTLKDATAVNGSVASQEYSDEKCATAVGTPVDIMGGVCLTATASRRRLALAVDGQDVVFVTQNNSAAVAGVAAAAVATVAALRM